VNQFLVPASAEAFGDVGHYADGCALELVAEAEVAVQGAAVAGLVDHAHQSSGVLPGFEVLKFGDRGQF